MPRLLALALPLVLVALAACEDVAPRKPDAVGEVGEVAVVMDSATWNGPAGEALRATLGRSVAPPLSISDFRLRRRDLTTVTFPYLRSSRAVVFATALDGDTSAVARFLEARLDSAGVRMIREGRGTAVVPRRDVWAHHQLVVFAAAATDSLLAEALTNAADTLRAALTELALDATEADMFARARQPEIEAELAESHGFAVHVQHDYFVSQDTTAAPAGHPGHFVRLRRVLSDTWRDFWVYYQDAPAPLDSAAVETLTDDLLRTFVLGQYDSTYVRLDRIRPIQNEPTTIAGRPAVLARGLWRMQGDLMGGPFVRYAFYEPEQRRQYVLFGMVFAPQHRFRGDKREFLRQMEVIARTFRSGPDAAPATG